MADDPNVTKTIEPFVGRLPDPPAPVDVRVLGTVKTQEQGESGFVTNSATMSNGTEPVVVLPADKRRTSATILNPPAAIGSGLTVWILSSRNASTSSGFPLVAGASLNIGHQKEVFAICPLATAAAQATVYYASEQAV